VIALWLGHESTATTHQYVEADLAMKARALAALKPPATRPLQYRPTDRTLQFLFMIMHGRCAGPSLARLPKDCNSMAKASSTQVTVTATMHNCQAHKRPV
jgi:hypothetical protein